MFATCFLTATPTAVPLFDADTSSMLMRRVCVAFNTIFSDDTPHTLTALQQHHSCGPPATWYSWAKRCRPHAISPPHFVITHATIHNAPVRQSFDPRPSTSSQPAPPHRDPPTQVDRQKVRNDQHEASQAAGKRSSIAFASSSSSRASGAGSLGVGRSGLGGGAGGGNGKEKERWKPYERDGRGGRK